MSIDTVPGEAADLGEAGERRVSLSTAAARNLATTTKTVPQMRAITPRWLLRVLPWVQVSGGTYRVNRRLTYAAGGGLVAFAQTGPEVRVVPPSLREIPLLAGLDDEATLADLAGRFAQRELEAGSVIARRGEPADEFYLVAHGKVRRLGAGAYDAEAVLGLVADGDHFGDEVLLAAGARAAEPGPAGAQGGAGAGAEADSGVWDYTAVATTRCTVLALPARRFRDLLDRSEPLREQVRRFLADARKPRNRRGEADVALASGHRGEPALPRVFVDYELAPREYELGVAQTVLRVHSRVADIYNHPMDQTEQQLRLTIEALRERQEAELINNRDFGLLHNVAYDQRVQTRSGPPTPDDLDDLLTRRRGTRLFLAHPKAIAAFGRECNRRGLYPGTVEVQGRRLGAWRGVPVFPCNKIPITDRGTSSILAMRTGADDQGVVGLRQEGIPHEVAPGLNARFMRIDRNAVISYLVSAYFSVAVLVPDALGALHNVEIAR